MSTIIAITITITIITNTITSTITIMTITITIAIAIAITITITITIAIIQHPSSPSIIIISTNNKNPFSLFRTCHTIDSGSLGTKLMFCGQSMPTPQLRRTH